MPTTIFIKRIFFLIKHLFHYCFIRQSVGKLYRGRGSCVARLFFSFFTQFYAFVEKEKRGTQVCIWFRKNSATYNSFSCWKFIFMQYHLKSVIMYCYKIFNQTQFILQKKDLQLLAKSHYTFKIYWSCINVYRYHPIRANDFAKPQRSSDDAVQGNQGRW